MSYKTYSQYSKKKTPQTEPIPGSDQVENNAGGYVYRLDEWKRLDRFLILGSEGGTYYVGQTRFTYENAAAVLRCIEVDGVRVVKRVVEISDAGRAPKNDPALFVLALCASQGNLETRQAALSALPQVARIGTHLFHFLEFCKGLRGWGRGFRTAVADWYNQKPVDRLAYQAVKYQQRDGWSHRDVLRQAHPIPPTPGHKALYHWITQKELTEEVPALIKGYHQLQKADNLTEVVHLIGEHKLPRETVPTKYLKEAQVWEALLPEMGLTALLRNLGNMSANGLLVAGNWAVIDQVLARLNSREEIQRARIHPIHVVLAYLTYRQAGGFRGKNKWAPVPQVVDALDEMVYMSFDFVEPTNHAYYLGVDVSGSMSGQLSGIPQMTCAQGAAVMAMTIARTEAKHIIKGFTSADGYRSRSTLMSDLQITPRSSLPEAFAEVRKHNFGATDCALPVLDALKQQLMVDVFFTITDNETWAGDIHPSQALQEYRSRINPKARMVVIGMTSTGFSIADPSDPLSLDVVGFDTSTPSIIAEFCREEAED
jgi:60 kDa SS-A/Ro ribonucleoprotein